MPTTPDVSTNPPTTDDSQARTAAPAARPAAKSDFQDEKATWTQQILLGVFVVIPFLAVLAAIPVAWGWGLNWHDVIIVAVFYWVSGLGITVGYHRYFTHSSFKAKTGLRVALAIAGSLAIEGPVITWVADHRRHHKYSDKEGDPHSPWRYGDDCEGARQGPALGAHRLAVRPEQDLAGEVRPRPARRHARSARSTTGSRRSSRSRCSARR